ncbi:MAG: nitrate reductase molybdenum cofactor assembly chaperone [Planctomycetota bacterium]|jgi:nitrate reductase molybdenum cofactor assembly chaperone
MGSILETYDLLASMLAYPDALFTDEIERCVDRMGHADKGCTERFRKWAGEMAGLTLEAQQELYARTFDMSPKCTLEIGWHLFGEQYDRGTFLVWMRGQMRELGLAESTDLPDHARHVLAVLGRLQPDSADSFATACVLPALEIVREGLKKLDSPYELLADAICQFLESRHGPAQRDLNSFPILNSEHEDLLRAEGM